MQLIKQFDFLFVYVSFFHHARQYMSIWDYLICYNSIIKITSLKNVRLLSEVFY